MSGKILTRDELARALSPVFEGYCGVRRTIEENDAALRSLVAEMLYALEGACEGDIDYIDKQSLRKRAREVVGL